MASPLTTEPIVHHASPTIVPVQLSATEHAAATAPAPAPAMIQISLQHGDLNLKVSWPADQSHNCAQWLRQWNVT
ncbi:hypothetical protein QR66_16960 [Chromobacterium piscinae]|nr:hypothetical protein QR66_16960 [Chromobacterium piscinae]